jgi:hypothetical protein
MSDARSPLRPLSRALRAAVLASLTAILLACGSAAPTPVPSGTPTASPAPTPTSSTAAASPSASEDPAAVYDAIEQQVIEIRGLQPKKPVDRQTISEAELRTMLTQQFDEQTPPAYLAANERLYKALGLMPQDASLRDLSLDLLSGGVAGFYRDDQGKLYVVSKTGAIGGNEKVTFAHEFTHALQDQTWTVFKDQKDVLDRSDWIMARQAVFEGDATVLMTQWLIAHGSTQDLQDIVAAGQDPAQAALLARIPAIMKETLLFPYTTGMSFIQGAKSQGDWAAVDKLYDRMPESTEQIMHPEKYAANEAPVKVVLPTDLATRLGTGWTVPLEDTFGEMQTGVWLREGGVATDAANDAAAGWGGDRLAVIEGPSGAWAVAWQTTWDTTADATAFETAATTAIGKAQGVKQVLPGVGGKTRWVLVASDAKTMGHVANVLGLAG